MMTCVVIQYSPLLLLRPPAMRQYHPVILGRHDPLGKIHSANTSQPRSQCAIVRTIDGCFARLNPSEAGSKSAVLGGGGAFKYF
jgi:hypothetical protein